LSVAGWKDMQKLVTLNDTFKGFVNDIERNENEWKKWYDLERPENAELPGIFKSQNAKDETAKRF